MSPLVPWWLAADTSRGTLSTSTLQGMKCWSVWRGGGTQSASPAGLISSPTAPLNTSASFNYDSIMRGNIRGEGQGKIRVTFGEGDRAEGAHMGATFGEG